MRAAREIPTTSQRLTLGASISPVQIVAALAVVAIVLGLGPWPVATGQANADAPHRAEWAPLKGSFTMSCTWGGGDMEGHCAYGDYDPYHPYPAIDIAASSGTTVRAAGNGKVTGTGYASNWGNWITIYHQDGDRTSLYAHFQSSAAVNEGQTVSAGEKIGSVGESGEATGPHLHYAEADGRHTTPFWQEADPPKAMRALHGDKEVSYPNHWGVSDWTPCELRSGEQSIHPPERRLLVDRRRRQLGRPD